MGGGNPHNGLKSQRIKVPDQIVSFNAVHFIHDDDNLVGLPPEEFREGLILPGHLGRIQQEEDDIRLLGHFNAPFRDQIVEVAVFVYLVSAGIVKEKREIVQNTSLLYSISCHTRKGIRNRPAPPDKAVKEG